MKLRYLITGVEIAGGHTLPRFWGTSYRKIDLDVFVCHPVPLNWIVGWCYGTYLRIKFRRPSWREADLRQAWETGYRKGSLAQRGQFRQHISKYLEEELLKRQQKIEQQQFEQKTADRPPSR